jgi:hypothetical protein
VVTADELEAECGRLRADRKWGLLRRCADELAPLAPERAAELREVAGTEAAAAPRVTAVQAALRDRNLRRARDELDQVPPTSIEHPGLKREYELAEAQAITELAAALERVKDAACERHDQLLARERATKPMRVTAEAARRAPCAPQRCIGEAYAEIGREQFAAGELVAALASFEAAYACRPEPLWSEKAFVVACNLGDRARARLHWRHLPATMKTRALGICVRNGITEPVLSAP